MELHDASSYSPSPSRSIIQANTSARGDRCPLSYENRSFIEEYQMKGNGAREIELRRFSATVSGYMTDTRVPGSIWYARIYYLDIRLPGSAAHDPYLDTWIQSVYLIGKDTYYLDIW